MKMKMDNRLLDELIELCKFFYNRQLVSSTGGNVSVRDGEELLITRSSLCLGRATVEDLVRVRADGSVASGGIPSKELQIHLGLLAEFPANNLVAHIHSAFVVTASCMLDMEMRTLPVFSPGFAAKVGYVPVVPYYLPGSTELSKAVVENMKNARAVILRNHGLVCATETIEEARSIVEEVEENARIFVLSGGKARALTPEQVAEARERYASK